MRTPLNDSRRTDFGWSGLAGAYASVDPVNNISYFYAQHVIHGPNRPLRSWLYRTLRADLFGESVEVPLYKKDANPELTY